MITEETMAQIIADALYKIDDKPRMFKDISTFEENGIRHNTGIVIEIEDGSEFQVTIVRSIEVRKTDDTEQKTD